MAQIELSGIYKHFTIKERPEGRFSALRGIFSRNARTVKALDGIGFSIEAGELVGYIGPNGAGKSTSVKVMSGILTPDGGQCRILGRVPWKERVPHVSQIGVVFGQRSQLWWDVPVSDSFDLLRDIYGVQPQAYRARVEELVEALSIKELLNVPVRQLSLGQRMRCELAAALIHSPRILFLDEPTIGLDAVSKLALRDFLKMENQKNGVTMVLTTHDMDDIQALCARVMVIGHGKLLYDGGMDALKRKYAPLTCLKVSLPPGVGQHPAALTEIRRVPGVREAHFEEGDGVLLYFDREENPTHSVIQAIAGHLPLVDVATVEQSIDKIIAAMYRDMHLG